VKQFEKDFRCSIHAVFPKWCDSNGVYRYLKNEKISEEHLINRIRSNCKKSVHDKRVIVIGDTVEFNIDNHKGRLKDTTGLGMVGRNKKVGFLSHSLLVLERASKFRLGWGGVELINRGMDNKPYTRDNGSVEIEEKESFKWIGPTIKCRDEVVNKSEHALFIADQEADIFEVLDRISDKKTDVLIRLRHHQRWVHTSDNRRLKVKDVLKELKPKCNVVVDVNGECKKRKKRKAQCEIRYTEVQIPVPSKKIDKSKHRETVKMTLLQIKENPETVPNSEKGLEWTFWTSEKIENDKQAIELIKCYEARWHIEEGFRLIKKKGFNFEATELESGNGIRKLLLLAMEASVKVMQLKAARGGNCTIKVNEIFSEAETELLHSLNKEYQGGTVKQQNPHQEDSLSWASWVIARIGGWKGFASQRPPGTITFKRGLDKFETMMLGIQISKRNGDVYKR